MPNRLIFNSPLRGTDGDTLVGILDSFQHTLASAITRGVPVSWWMRYDTLNDPDYYGPIQDATANYGHAAGIWLEISPGHAADAGVTYNTAGTREYSACRVTTLGYDHLTQRAALIDTAFAKFHSRFGKYPGFVGHWLMDSWSVAYMRDTYGIRAIGICRNQNAEDAYNLIRHPENQFWEAAEGWLAIPARGRSGRSGVAVAQVHTTDLLNNYGSRGGQTPQQLYALEPTAVQRMGLTTSGYLTRITDDILSRTQGRYEVINSYLYENGFGWTTDPAGDGFGSRVEEAMDAMAARADGTHTVMSTFDAAATAFRTRPRSERDGKVIQSVVNDYVNSGSGRQCVEVQTSHYNARFSFKEGEAGSEPWFGLTSLAVYSPNLPDPNAGVASVSDFGHIDVPDAIPAQSYGVVSAVVTAQTRQDTPGHNTIALAPIYYDGVFYDWYSDDGSGVANTSLSLIHSPTLADPRLKASTALSGSIEVTARTRAVLWDWRCLATTAGALVLTTLGAWAPDGNIIAYWQIGSDDEQTQVIAGGAFSDQTTVNNFNYCIIAAGNGAIDSSITDNGPALLIAPVSGQLVGGSLRLLVPYGGGAIQFGVESSGAALTGAQFAVIPCLRSEVRDVLAEWQSNPEAFILDNSETASKMDTASGLSVGISVGIDSGADGGLLGLDPAGLPGLAVWYDAAAAGTLWRDTGGTMPAGDSEVVRRWDDLSGNGRHAFQSGATVAPSRAAGGPGFPAAVVFDGVDDRLSVPDYSGYGLGDVSVWAVVQLADADTTRINSLVGAETSGGFQARVGDGTGMYLQMVREALAGIPPTGTRAVPCGDGSVHTVGFTYSPATGTGALYVDGVRDVTAVAAPQHPVASAPSIGSNYPLMSEFLSGGLSGLAVCEAVLTPAHFAALHRWARSHYAPAFGAE